ncbi:MAG TPA: DUF4349 domain-containing protein [Candidatus Acidoferrum sp.]|jgi:hypothetical protein
MSDAHSRHLMSKTSVLIAGSIVIVLCYFVFRVSTEQYFTSVDNARVSGLSGTSWDMRSMWVSTPMLQRNAPFELSSGGVARAAQLRESTSNFDNDVASLNKIVAGHHGYFEDLRTQTQSGRGRLLSVALAVPGPEFDSTVAELKSIGRLVAISEAGEDANVRLANQARQVAEAQTNLARLQRLQKDHASKLLDALSLEKEIAQAAANVSQSEREQENLQSTVAKAHISFMLLEDYRAPLNARLDGHSLQLRNALIEGVGAIVSTVAMLLALVLQYGLPLAFWLAVLYFPIRAIRNYLRRTAAPVPTPVT